MRSVKPWLKLFIRVFVLLSHFNVIPHFEPKKDAWAIQKKDAPATRKKDAPATPWPENTTKKIKKNSKSSSSTPKNQTQNWVSCETSTKLIPIHGFAWFCWLMFNKSSSHINFLIPSSNSSVGHPKASPFCHPLLTPYASLTARGTCGKHHIVGIVITRIEPPKKNSWKPAITFGNKTHILVVSKKYPAQRRRTDPVGMSQVGREKLPFRHQTELHRLVVWGGQQQALIRGDVHWTHRAKVKLPVTRVATVQGCYVSIPFQKSAWHNYTQLSIEIWLIYIDYTVLSSGPEDVLFFLNLFEMSWKM